jgi:tetratricopeptide (TPR) repeat protein
MAGKLSRIAQHRRWMLVAGFWLPVAASALGDEGVRVSPVAKVIENPFATQTASRPQSQPQPPATPPLPEAGPRMYQNPFVALDTAERAVAGQPSASSEAMPLGPGPISRWRQPIQQPYAVDANGAAMPLDPIQNAPRPLGTVPAAVELPTQPANPFSDGLDAADLPLARPQVSTFVRGQEARAQRELPIVVPTERDVLVPESLAQPSWLLPDDSPDLLDAPAALLGPTRHDPFDAVDQSDNTARFVSPARNTVESASLESAFDLDPSQTVVEDHSSEGPQDWLARVQEAAPTANTPSELSSLVVLCRQGIAADVPREQRESLRQLAAWALNRRGELAGDGGRSEAALDDFEAALELDPQCWLALHNRAVSYAQQHRTTDALRDFNRVIALNPGLAMAYRNRGELLGSLDRTEEAVRDYTQAIAQLPNDAELYLIRGHAWHRLGQYERALDDLNRSIKLAPDQPDAYTQRGNVHAERGDFREAINDFQQSLRLDPNSAEAYRSLAWLLATCPDPAVSDPQQAVAAARRAAALAPADDCYVLDTLAAAYASAGQFAKAVQYQQQAVAAAPEDFASSLHERLELYQQRQPYRNAPTDAVQPAAYEDSSPSPKASRPR